jgi:hypothetical protein
MSRNIRTLRLLLNVVFCNESPVSSRKFPISLFSQLCAKFITYKKLGMICTYITCFDKFQKLAEKNQQSLLESFNFTIAFRIRIQILGLDYGTGSEACPFWQLLSRSQQKMSFLKRFIYVIEKSQNSKNQFILLFLLVDARIRIKRPKNIRILQIQNTFLFNLQGHRKTTVLSSGFYCLLDLIACSNFIDNFPSVKSTLD